MRLLYIWIILCVCAANVKGHVLFPFDLVDRIRFYHLQEVFYNKENEVALRQAEEYLAQDLVESIEDLSFAIGFFVDRRFLPATHTARFKGWQTFENKYKHIPYAMLIPHLTARAYSTFERQRFMATSSILLDELEPDWLVWYETILAVSAKPYNIQ